LTRVFNLPCLFLEQGKGVITMAMIGKVKRMYFREKKSVREIVRLTSLSRNTVRKWLKAAVLEEPRYRRSEAPASSRRSTNRSSWR
jgi:hypothetical protein